MVSFVLLSYFLLCSARILQVYCKSLLLYIYFISPADLIFFIYLYQRWIYKVDPRRMNEFGTSAELPHGGQIEVDETGRPIEGAATPAISALAESPVAATASSPAPVAIEDDPDGLDDEEPPTDSPSTAESNAGNELRRRMK